MIEYNPNTVVDRRMFAGKKGSTCTFEIYEQALRDCNFKYHRITDGTDNPSQETLADYEAARQSFVLALSAKEALLVKHDSEPKIKNKIIKMWNDASPDESDDTRKF